MTPILFEKSEQKFDSNGIGRLSDCIKCVVSERINDFYTLDLTYLATGNHADEIQPGCLILADPNETDRPQPFRIYEISKNLDGNFEVSANHISYDLSGIPARNITGITTASGAVAALNSRAVISTGFTFSTDLSVSKNYEKRGGFSVRSAMGGTDSIQETYGGEWYYDRYSCQLLTNRGEDNGVTIRYGKNLKALNATSNDTEEYTGAYAYYYSNNRWFHSNIIYSDQYAIPQKILMVDHTSDYQSDPTTAELDANATADLAAAAGLTNSFSIEFSPLWQSDEYKDFAPIERVKLGDFVTVFYEKYDISAKLEVVETVYNVLTDRYDSIELGAIRPDFAETIINLKK